MRASLSTAGYAGIYGGLVVLTTATFLVHKYTHLGWFQLPVALLIACAKGGLIVWFFMHLGSHRGPSRIAALVPVVFLFVLTILSWADLRTRFHPTMPPGPFPLHLEPGQRGLSPAQRGTTQPRPELH